MLRFFIVLSTLLTFFTEAYSQCSSTITSTDGYKVIIRINPVAIIPSSNDCPWGYNYNVSLNYTVSFTGSNIPSGGLYTLQGNLICNGSQSLFYDLPNSGGTGNYVTGSNPFISNDGGTAYLYTTHPSCNAATYSNLGCGAITIDINGPGIANQTINCGTTTLPIELLYFKGSSLNKGAFLNWETQTEKNNDFFTIEKSLDGTSWEQVGEIKGAGNSFQPLNYSFVDDKVEHGINYYRLKQTDFDRNYSYSPVIEILNSAGSIVCGKIWPNPFSDQYTVEVLSPVNSRAKYNVMNDLGTVIESGDMEFFSGKNEIQFSTQNYKPGFHVLEIIFDENNKVYRKIVRL